MQRVPEYQSKNTVIFEKIAKFLNNFAVRLAFCDSMYYNEA